MIENGELDKRHVLPRWLTIAKARDQGMFARPGLTPASQERDLSRTENSKWLLDAFERCVHSWNRTSELSEAEDLLAVGFLASREEDASVQSAAFLIATHSESGLTMREFAQSILDGTVRDAANGNHEQTANTSERIRRRKSLLRLNPRDALLLTETALLYTTLGQVEQSNSLLNQALALFPHSRYVLRSAARFYCHIENPQRALDVIQKSPRHQTDPWLKSAELAIASLCGAPIRNWRQSKRLVEDHSLATFDRSELAAELATLDFETGGRRAGMKNVYLAVGDPTENAAAQIEFLAERTKDFSREEVLPDISNTTEARALSAYWRGELRAALDACEDWQEMEPFSARPAIFGSFLSTARFNDPVRGIRMAERGLASNANDMTLLNNLAVLNAYRGSISVAEKYAERARLASDQHGEIANVATKGLIFFRQGKISEGIREYERSMELAVQARRVDLYVRAFAFLGREMARVDRRVASYFADELAKADLQLRKRNQRLPREVALMQSEFLSDALATEELSSAFSPQVDLRIDRIVDS